jgi:hypothetical protein
MVRKGTAVVITVLVESAPVTPNTWASIYDVAKMNKDELNKILFIGYFRGLKVINSK